MFQGSARGAGKWRFHGPVRAGREHAASGFTLVELMVTIFVAAILIAIAVPSFKHITASSRLTTVTNGMVDALNVARMEAIKRNADTQFCGAVDAGSGDLHNACGIGQPGAVYAQTGAAGATTTVLIQAAPVLQTTNMHLPTVNAIRFNAQGLGSKAGAAPAYTGTVAEICSSSISSKNIRTIKMTTGSILETTTSDGKCP